MSAAVTTAPVSGVASAPVFNVSGLTKTYLMGASEVHALLTAHENVALVADIAMSPR